MIQKLKGSLPLVVAVIVVVAGLYFLAKSNDSKSTVSNSLPTSYEYYWGNGCPHCLVVAEFLDGWTGRDKVSIEKKEVWNNQANYLQMQKRAEYCQLDKNSLGVPLLFTPEGKCFVGSQPIIDLFTSLNL
jgi:hypothetical protein